MLKSSELLITLLILVEIKGNGVGEEVGGLMPVRSDQEILDEFRAEDHLIVGDMIFDKPTERMAKVHHPNWPYGNVPFMISDNVTQDLRNVIQEAIEYLNRYTCLTFHWRQPRDKYWLRFIMDPSSGPNTLCASYVGWLNRPDQAVFLGPKCRFGSMVHELLHAIGFSHEHQRNDRDRYITVNWDNIAGSMKSQYKLDRHTCDFNEDCVWTDYGVKYNFESIMHYCDTCTSIDYWHKTFSINPGTDGIGDPKKVGQREGFSQGDWLMVNRKYQKDTGCKLPNLDKPPPLSDDPEIQDSDEEEPSLTPGPTKKPCKKKQAWARAF